MYLLCTTNHFCVGRSPPDWSAAGAPPPEGGSPQSPRGHSAGGAPAPGPEGSWLRSRPRPRPLRRAPGLGLAPQLADPPATTQEPALPGSAPFGGGFRDNLFLPGQPLGVAPSAPAFPPHHSEAPPASTPPTAAGPREGAQKTEGPRPGPGGRGGSRKPLIPPSLGPGARIPGSKLMVPSTFSFPWWKEEEGEGGVFRGRRGGLLSGT